MFLMLSVFCTVLVSFLLKHTKLYIKEMLLGMAYEQDHHMCPFAKLAHEQTWLFHGTGAPEHSCLRHFQESPWEGRLYGCPTRKAPVGPFLLPASWTTPFPTL